MDQTMGLTTSAQIQRPENSTDLNLNFTFTGELWANRQQLES